MIEQISVENIYDLQDLRKKFPNDDVTWEEMFFALLSHLNLKLVANVKHDHVQSVEVIE